MKQMILLICLIGCANAQDTLIVEDFTPKYDHDMPINIYTDDLNMERCIGLDDFTLEQTAEEIVQFCCCVEDEETGLTICTEY